MANFTINTFATVTYSIGSGEYGFVGPAGVLHNTGTTDVLRATGNTLSAKVVVEGAVYSQNGQALHSTGQAGVQLTIGKNGSMSSAGDYAIIIENDTSGFAYIQSAGTISGGIRLLQGSGSSNTTPKSTLDLINSGTISNVGSAVTISANYGTHVITNTGMIVGFTGIILSDYTASLANLDIFNSGTIVSTLGSSGASISAGYGEDKIVNTGELIGRVDLDDGDDFFNGKHGQQWKINGGAGDDTIFGGKTDEELYGNDNNDRIFAGLGDDIIYGGDGNDTMRGGEGGDDMYGGNGLDWVYYHTSDGAIDIDLETGLGFGGHAELDTFSSVERAKGSRYDDVITGSTKANYLVGRGGDDTITGGDGNDILRGDAGADHLLGGNGSDWVFYTGSNSRVVINIAGQKVSGGHAKGDVISNIENANGSRYDDIITGSNGANRLNGFFGDDWIRPLRGNDTLSGGDGADTFVFNLNTGRDIISDMENDVDKIDLSAYNFASKAQVLAITDVRDGHVYIEIDSNDIIRISNYEAFAGDLADDLIL